MDATGAKRPLIYILGEGPGRVEDETGVQFMGDSGQLLRSEIPRAFKDKIRWNNTVNCRPPRNATPDHTIVECCRPRVVSDIAKSRPKVIFGFGNVPLQWICGFTGISNWRGRRMPVNIDGHVCWYYPMFHPAFLVRKGRGSYTSEDERMFRIWTSSVPSLKLKICPLHLSHTPLTWSGRT
jgi:DNA polymerase